MAENIEVEGKIAQFLDSVLVLYQQGKLKGELQKLPSGLEYVVHERGEGKMPESNKMVEVHYFGVLEDGKMFDNSFRRGEPFGFTLGVGRVIQGWDEGIAQLPVGTKATLFIPYDMAYGETGSPPVIPEKADLVFYVELVSAE